ncbi:DUF1579 family protein [Dyadobacter sp. CY356]|uniref:DUF1579 family protein n=1 Tax=Dyadobacter sp. CY356 TaxID=2906442 RepID=UPI001F4696FF|nr:DUF1579 family protein [Dyadobacter sp. CY356]MCF0055118.1 DUF1579 domain-containing protein [Dyadobacter sp. CY356]
MCAALMLISVFSATACFSQEIQKATVSDTARKRNDDMKLMLAYSGPGKYHMLLDQLAGIWKFSDPKRPFVKGILTRTPIYDGRFYSIEITGGKLALPVADGKLQEGNYQNLLIEGYDNVKGKFVTISINNHIGSGIQMQEGTFDPNKKAFIYDWDEELVPGRIKSNRKILTILDNAHYLEEYYQQIGGQQVLTRTISFEKTEEK